MLVAKGRMSLPDDVRAWRRLNLRQGLSEIPPASSNAARSSAMRTMFLPPTLIPRELETYLALGLGTIIC